MKALHLFATVLFLSLAARAAAEFDHSHRTFDSVLKAVVREGRVNYRALKADPRQIDSYLDQLAAVPEKEFMSFADEEKIVFLINLYNASILKLVADHYPIKGVREIGNWLRGPFDQKVVRLMGRTLSLADIEHGTLRRNHYEEPRFHFALTCAATGSPPLRGEAYQAGKLNTQLDDQARRFLAGKAAHYFNPAARTLVISKMFKWYEKDFIRKEKSVLAFIQPYLPVELAAEVKKGGCQVAYSDYDWSLNDSEKKPEPQQLPPP
jgi:hypothetical protein